MANNIADLVVSLSADIASFRDGMAQSKKALSDLQSQFSSAKDAASSFIEKIGEIVAAREVVKFLEDSAEATRAWAEELAKFQGLAGLSSKEAATFAASAELAGVQTDVIATAMARLGTTIATHPQKFQQLGISIRDASGQLLPMTEIMRNTIAGLDEFKAGTDRATAAGFLFGRGAEAWITQLDKLGPELKSGEWAQTSELVKTLGLSMENAKATAEEWAKAQGMLKLELLGVENQIGQALLPAIQTLGSEIAVWAKNGDLKNWAEDAARGIVGLTIDLAEMTDFIASHNQIFGTVLALGGVGALAESPSIAGRAGGLAALIAGWKMTGSAADEASAKVHEDVAKMVADLKEAQAKIGQHGNSASGDFGPSAPDGTKTFNVPDPKTQQLNDSITTLVANFQRETQQNEQLAVAMGKGGDAAKKLQDQFTALNKIDAIRAQALRDGITLSDSQVASLTKLALAEGQSADVLQRATQLHNNLAEAMKKQDEEIQKLVQSSSLLTPKQNEIADKEGLLIAAFNQGSISAQQFNDAIKQLQDQLNGPDKGMEEFTKGLSSDLDTAIAKMTDFSAMIEEKQKTKGKDSIFAQLDQDANEFTASLEKMLLKLLVINPLLNELGLGGQGDNKQLPTLWGNSGGVGGPGTATTPFSAVGSSIVSGGKSVLGFLSGLFGGTSVPGAAVDADSATGAGLNSDIVDALTGGGIGGAGGFDFGAFAEGGDFTVPGSGGTDSKRVSFLASPGERVSIMPELASRGRGSGADSAPARSGDINISMPISGVHSDTFRANRHQITGDMLRAISAGRRYS